MTAHRLLAALAFLLLAGCGTFQVGFESAPSLEASPAASPVILPSSLPTSPAVQSLPKTPSPVPQMVKIYLIALEDGGQSGLQVGCGDSAVPVDVPISPTKEVLKAAMESLLSLQTQYYGQSGLYNALHQSDLRLDSVNIKDGVAIINLSGSLQLGGECDSPRVEAQIEQTALQFATVKEASVSLNGRSLQDALSLK